VSDRGLGVLLFLPVPVVLFLFTQAPLGIVVSLALGVALMVTHRLYARPFALARAERRCLWCGRAATAGPLLAIAEPPGPTRWRTCGEPHADRVRRFLGWASSHRRLLQVGILGSLAALLLLAVLAALGRSGPLRHADAVTLFRLGIGATVLPLSLLGPSASPAPEPLRPPFPVHIQALIGTAAVVWLFRIVGVIWIALALYALAGRA
jgi:hypothetical protein